VAFNFGVLFQPFDFSKDRSVTPLGVENNVGAFQIGFPKRCALRAYVDVPVS
jgi:hypothetical protein